MPKRKYNEKDKGTPEVLRDSLRDISLELSNIISGLPNADDLRRIAQKHDGPAGIDDSVRFAGMEINQLKYRIREEIRDLAGPDSGWKMKELEAEVDPYAMFDAFNNYVNLCREAMGHEYDVDEEPLSPIQYAIDEARDRMEVPVDELITK